MNRNRLLLSTALISAAIIAFQLALIQVLSNVQWYHFAYMVISIALLGFGAAGSVLTIFRAFFNKHSDVLIPVLMITTGAMMVIVTALSQTDAIKFDSYLLFSDYSHIRALLFTYLVFFIPFLIGALSIGLLFVKYVNEIGKVYFANLCGSGAGGLLALVLIWYFFPNRLPALIGFIAVLAGLLIITGRHRVFQYAFAVICIVLIGWRFFNPPQLLRSEYKDLSKTLLLPEARIIAEQTSPYGVVQMVSSPVLRYAPGMSLTAQNTATIRAAAFVNGDWFGAITDWQREDTSMILDYTTASLPYEMASRNKVLVLQAGTGIDIAHAITRKVDTMVAAEANAVILSLVKNRFAPETDSLFLHPDVVIHNVEPRTFLSTDTSHYDLIVLPVIGTFGGSSGLHALQERFTLTKESFHDMWRKLRTGGAVAVTSWMDYPLRNPLKILSTMVEVLEELGIKDPAYHIAAVRSWGTITFVMTKSPLNNSEIKNIRAFCDQMLFDPAILPGLQEAEKAQYNELQDRTFFGYINQVFSAERTRLYEDYVFNIRPATDNRPYFSQYIKWSQLERLSSFFGNRSLPFFEVGYLLVMLTLIQITIASFLFIILPLFKIGWKGKDKWRVVIYFTGIGLGYMFIEMVLIQRFILYFGNPVYSASAVITVLLIFSGLGSYFSNKASVQKKWLPGILAVIVSLIILNALILTPALRHTVHFGIIPKAMLLILLTAPLAFCMGIPFPAALAKLSANQDVIPWAWAINGCVSVISTALATIVSVEMGFMWVMLFAGIGYCLPLVVAARWK